MGAHDGAAGPEGRARAGQRRGQPVTIHVLSAQELERLDIPEPRCVIEPILPEGLTLFGGRPKMGKSWLALHIGLAVAQGGRALGRLVVEPGAVLYLALEDNWRRIKRRMRLALQGQPWPAGLHVTTEWPRLGDGGEAALDAWLGRDHPETRLVIVDTLARIRGRAGSAGGRSLYLDDYEALTGLHDLAARYQVAVLVVTHVRKAEADDPLDLINATLGLTGCADNAWVLKRERGQHDAVLIVDGRDIEDLQELALVWDATLCSWRLVGPAEEYRLSRERSEVLQLLRESKAPLSPHEVASLLGRDHAAVRQLMARMARDGLLVAARYGHYRPAAGPGVPPGASAGSAGPSGSAPTANGEARKEGV